MERDRRTPDRSRSGADAPQGNAPGKRSLTDSIEWADGAVSLASSEVGDAMGDDGEETAGEDGAPTQIAEAGFRGASTELPFRGELEKSFGVSFAGVRAHTDPDAQDASAKLGAKAYASGNRIAFATPNPDKALVAHELTHVLQHTGQGPAKKSENSGAGGIETSGEGEAERVEAAVASGKPARSALEGDHATNERAGPATGPALKAGQKPALSASVGIGKGMTFSPTGLERSGTYKLWKAPEFRIPIPAVPGLTFKVAPNVAINVAAGVDWSKKRVSAPVGVAGSVGLGFAYGAPYIAEVDATLSASARGSFTYERTKTPKKTSLDGYLGLSSGFSVGVTFGGGLLDARWDFGSVDIGWVTGVAWKNGKLQTSNLGWKWGPAPEAFFKKLKELINKVKALAGLVGDAAKKAWNGVKDGIGGAAGAVKGKIVGAASSIGGAAKWVGDKLWPF